MVSRNTPEYFRQTTRNVAPANGTSKYRGHATYIRHSPNSGSQCRHECNHAKSFPKKILNLFHGTFWFFNEGKMSALFEHDEFRFWGITFKVQ